MHNFFSSLKLKIVTILALCFVVPSLWAATATTTFLVTATILSACLVTALPLAFGTYDPTSATPLDQTTTITSTCTLGTTYTLGLNAGTGVGGTTTTRVMTGTPAGLLNYQLFQNAGRTTNWGNNPGTDTVAGTGTGLPQLSTVYGRIPATQNQPAGSYLDTITVTLTY